MSRKLDLSRFRDDDSDDDNPFVPKVSFGVYAPVDDTNGAETDTQTKLELTDLKSKVFALGNTKKSKKDLEREAEERRKKEDEEAAKLVMAEYEEAFEKPSGSTTRNRFVPAGGFVKAAATPVPVIPKGPKSMENIPRGPAAMGYGRPTRPSPPKQPSPPPGPKPRGKRAMDAFLEELKRSCLID
ncbi:hypothetical protein M231_03756 [Tremella mesenterica]|uniref:Uncharacterized protein n=1 Tax=Tremella mesenterica TaxID=5217 RepID=A0A4Q1BMI6_TREME|nr:hypothetical protein M231_03756 [Tremella mesenterica]